jgi:AraC-like DNA-binding protein
MNALRTYALNPGLAMLLADLGIDRANVLRRAMLPDDLITRGPTMLTAHEYFGLWASIEAEAHEPALPVKIGQQISVESFDPPIFAAICSPNLHVAAQRIAQHKRLIGPVRLVISQTNAGLVIEYCWPEDAQPPAVLVLTELVFWAALARIATRHPVRPLAVVAPVLPDAPSAYTDYFGVAVEYGNHQSITFAREDSTRPFLTANPHMWAFFEPELRRRLRDLDQGASVYERVRSVLLEMLPAGQATIEAVSDKFAISPRTLQRRLSAEGKTFQDTLNQTREALARHYLVSSALPTAEIAFLLGYEDPSSFYRAFRDWTGQTPERVRTARA